MPLLEALPVGPGVAQWPVWSTTARVVTTDPRATAAARELVEERLAAVDLAASRFRPDSEVRRLETAHGRPTQVSPLLAELVGVALDAAAAPAGTSTPPSARSSPRWATTATSLGSASAAPACRS